MSNYNDPILNIFRSIRGVDGKEFGQSGKEYHGLSDDAKGVQWNIAVSKENRNTRLGVNLEGITYQNWPIAKFIENEKNEMRLCDLNNLPQAEKIIVGFYRDAWRGGKAPPLGGTRVTIIEKYLGGKKFPLCEIDTALWNAILQEAQDCLDKDQGYKGRAIQEVTEILKNDNKKPKQLLGVSPHLNIHMCLPYVSSKTEMKKDIYHATTCLQPVYDLVMKQS